MYSEWHYKSLYLFGHPRGTWVFSKLQGLRIIFPKIVAAILKIVTLRKWEFLLILLSIAFRFPKF